MLLCRSRAVLSNLFQAAVDRRKNGIQEEHRRTCFDVFRLRRQVEQLPRAKEKTKGNVGHHEAKLGESAVKNHALSAS